MALLESGEMYLETILILSRKKPYVRSVDVGEYMGYSKPSVSRAMGLLKSGGYILISEEGHISLTESGREVAEMMARFCEAVCANPLVGYDQGERNTLRRAALITAEHMDIINDKRAKEKKR